MIARLLRAILARLRRDADELDAINADEYLADRAREAVPRLLGSDHFGQQFMQWVNDGSPDVDDIYPIAPPVKRKANARRVER